jgi:hypothetical protein
MIIKDRINANDFLIDLIYKTIFKNILIIQLLKQT